jgi:hypothetical protein
LPVWSLQVSLNILGLDSPKFAYEWSRNLDFNSITLRSVYLHPSTSQTEPRVTLPVFHTFVPPVPSEAFIPHLLITSLPHPLQVMEPRPYIRKMYH